jgi:transposase
VARGRKRRVWSDKEKRAICAQTRVPGVSVSQVARRYNANTNLVFTWLRDPRFAPGKATEETSTFLPIEIVGELGCPAEPASPAVESRIEIELAGGPRLRITGAYDPDALARLIRGLSA